MPYDALTHALAAGASHGESKSKDLPRRYPFRSTTCVTVRVFESSSWHLFSKECSYIREENESSLGMHACIYTRTSSLEAHPLLKSSTCTIPQVERLLVTPVLLDRLRPSSSRISSHGTRCSARQLNNLGLTTSSVMYVCERRDCFWIGLS